MTHCRESIATAAPSTLLMFPRLEHLTPLPIGLPFVLFPLGGYFRAAFMWTALKKRPDASRANGAWNRCTSCDDLRCVFAR